MRTLAIALAALALLTLLPGAAHAQQSAALTLQMQPPAEPLREGQMLTFPALVAYTSDWTGAISSYSGTPVSYSVSGAPAWANVVVSPASDVFPAPSSPTIGLSYTVVRQVMVTVTLAQPLEHDASDTIEITAVTTPGPGGRAAAGKGMVPILFDAPDELCDEAHAEELLAMAREAAQEYAGRGGADVGNAAPAQPAQPPEEEVTVQNTSATPLSLPWLAVGGFALVGAGVGLVLRKRLGRP